MAKVVLASGVDQRTKLHELQIAGSQSETGKERERGCGTCAGGLW